MMRSSYVSAVLLSLAVGSLGMQKLRTNVSDRDSHARTRCGPEEIQHATAMLPASRRSLSTMRTSPCLRDVAAAYEQGLEDPEDAVEFLGACDTTPNPGCVKRVLPGFLYLGMEHAGSTTLAEELNRHPQLSYGKAKEHRYWTKFGNSTFSSNLEEYQNTFPVACTVSKGFDATPNMFGLALEHPAHACHVWPGEEGLGAKAMKTLKQALGNDTQLLVMLRDPVKVMMSRQPGKAWELNAKDAVEFCECFQQGIAAWMTHFPREQFHFMHADELFNKPGRTLNAVFDFLGVSRQDYSGQTIVSAGRRRSAARYPKTEKAKKQYSADIQACKTGLETLTGLHLAWQEGTTS